MHLFLRLIGAIASADVLIKTLCLVNYLSVEAEKLADRLEEIEQSLEEN